MPKQFYPPRFDYVFKRIFGDQRNINILASFLMAALNLPEEDLGHLTIVDPHLKRGEEYRRIERVVSIVICGGVLLSEETGYYNTYSIRNVRSGLEFSDALEINILEPAKLPGEADGGRLFKWGQFFKAETPEELAMAAETDPVIRKAVAQVMELNEDERERMLADARWRWQMDQAALRQDSYDNGLAEGEKKAEAKYQAVLVENQAIKQAIGEKDRTIGDLRRKLREAGIDT
jgi:predicted transposase/invertase (TIGR01784 family)